MSEVHVLRMQEEVTRDDQEPEVLYVLPDGSCFLSPDGEGRYFYDSEQEAWDQHGEDVPTIHIDRTDD